MSNRIAVLVGMLPEMPPQLVDRQFFLLGNMARSCPDADIFVDRRKITGTSLRKHHRHEAMSELRNGWVQRHVDLDYHTHVLFLDADLVQYPSDLPNLLARHEGCVVGTANTMEGRRGRWFDTAGYLERVGGRVRRARIRQPHFRQTGDIIELESVGLAFLVPSEVFREGKFAPPPPALWTVAVEHYAICQHAKRMGYRVIADLTVSVTHARWRKYGGKPRERTGSGAGQPNDE